MVVVPVATVEHSFNPDSGVLLAKFIQGCIYILSNRLTWVYARGHEKVVILNTYKLIAIIHGNFIFAQRAFSTFVRRLSYTKGRLSTCFVFRYEALVFRQT